MEKHTKIKFFRSQGYRVLCPRSSTNSTMHKSRAEMRLKMTTREKIAKIIRAVTVPPVMVYLLLTILYFAKDGIIAGPSELLLSILFLGIVPLFAYPLSFFIPSWKSKGREWQRKLAFILTFAGYLVAVVYGLIAHASYNLMLIYHTYFISVLILILFNKFIKIRASGHACSIAGPLFLMIYFIGWKSVLPCILLFAIVTWASLELKRHTFRELIWGELTAAVAFVISLTFIKL